MALARRFLPAFAILAVVASRAGATTVTIAGHPYELGPHPRVLFDGPAGTIVARLKDPDGSGPRVAPQATTANPAYSALIAQVRSCVAATPACTPSPLAETVALTALDWFMDNSQQRSLTAAKGWLAHIETLAAPGSGFGCDLQAAECGDARVSDALAADLGFLALAYTLVRGALSGEERTAFAHKMLNGVDGAPCRNQLQAGELKKWDEGTCGLVWMLQHDQANPRGKTIGVKTTKLATSIAADQTSIALASTADLPQRFPYYLSLNGAEIVQVVRSDGGGLEVARAQLGTTAAAMFAGRPVYFSRTMPSIGVTDYAGSAVLQKLFGYAFIANALADDEHAAVTLFEDVVDDWLNLVLPKNKDMWTGFQQGGSSDFGSARQLTQNAALTAMLKQLKGTPALDESNGNWLKAAVPAYLYSTLPPAPRSFVPWGEPALAVSSSPFSHQWAAILSGLYGADDQDVSSWNHWQRKVSKHYREKSLSERGSERFLLFALIYNQESDPSFDYTARYPRQRAFDTVDGTPSYALSAWISRSGWERADDTVLFATAFPSGWSDDHMGSGAPAAFKIYKNGWVLTENTETDTGVGTDTNMVIFGEQANLAPSRQISIVRKASDEAHSSYTYILMSSLASYHAKAAAIRALRSIVHLKKRGTRDFIVVYDALGSSAGQRKTINLYFDKSPHERSTMTSARLPGLVWTGPNRRLSATVVLPSGKQVFAQHAETPHAHHVALCASTDGQSCDPNNIESSFLLVYRPAADPKESMPAVRMLDDIDAGHVGVEILASDPKVAVFPKAGMPLREVSFTTTYARNGQVLITGLEAGIYDIRRNGEVVCAGISVSAASEAAYCELASGAIVASRRAPLPPPTHSSAPHS